MDLDLAQIAIWAFWIFFAGLVYYLLRESKREGYPLVYDDEGTRAGNFGPDLPAPKTFKLLHGGTVSTGREDTRDIKLARQPGREWFGAPYRPTGNPLTDGVGPAAYAERVNEPDLTFEGLPKIAPMRILNEFSVAEEDPDPRGMAVLDAENNVVGTVTDIWVDRGEQIIRYFEIEIGAEGAKKRVLLPFISAKVDRAKKVVHVESLLSSQFADVPTLRNPDQVTLLEEDMICAYYSGGRLYATPKRQEPFI